MHMKQAPGRELVPGLAIVHNGAVRLLRCGRHRRDEAAARKDPGSKKLQQSEGKKIQETSYKTNKKAGERGNGKFFF